MDLAVQNGNRWNKKLHTTAPMHQAAHTLVLESRPPHSCGPLYHRKKLNRDICIMSIQQYIEINPNVRFGKPIIKGTRISVYDVLNWLANGMTKTDIIEDFPELTENHINACLLYASEREGHIGIAS